MKHVIASLFFFISFFASASPCNEEVAKVTRRGFFRAASLAIAASQLPQATAKEATADVASTTVAPMKSTSASKTTHTYRRTALETGGVLAAETIGLAVSSTLRDAQTVAPKHRQNYKDPSLVQSVFEAPLIEELLFRGLPAAVFGKSWWVGVPSSILFGFAHDQVNLPVTQTAGGFFFWHLIRAGGLTHCILAHALHNGAIHLAKAVKNMTE